MSGMTVEQALTQANRAFAANNLVEAERLCRLILSQRPSEAGAMQLLAIIGMHVGQTAGALDLFDKAARLRPADANLLANYAHALKLAGRLSEARQRATQALAADANHPQANKIMAGVLSAEGQQVAAIAQYRRAIELAPADAESHAGVATLLAECGRVEESVQPFRDTLRLRPNLLAAHCNLLFALFSHPTLSPVDAANEHRAWARLHAGPIEAQGPAASANDRSPSRRLRVGYVCNDFRDHPVGRFILPVLEQHDRSQFEVFAYSNSAAVDDAVTAEIRQHVDHWHAIPWMNDDAVAQLIRSHQIDILVDLIGHTTRGRLLVFARRPAPVQVAYLAYPGTTGLAAMNYRLTDAYADPPGQTEPFHTETLLRLPDTFLTFRPPADCPMVQPVPPALRDPAAGVTFGCFNTLRKINRPLIEDWCRILQRVPNSRLVLKCQAFGDPQVQNDVWQRFADSGIARERVHLRPWEKTAAHHLTAYDEIDIALDTHPYNGTTTTCEALWMGMPVVTLAGASHVGRVSGSILTAIGLPQLIATTREDYAALAASVAADLPTLAEWRMTMRQRIASSPLADAAGLTRQIERQFRAIWQTHCQT